MDFDAVIRAAGPNPHKLEQLYQEARQTGEAEAFRSALLACYETAPDNLLYAAWFHRLQQDTESPTKQSRPVNWAVAVPLSILTGLIFWAISDVENLLVRDFIPHLLLWWAPIATMNALVFLALTSRKHYRRALGLGLGLLGATAYAILLAPTLEPDWKIEQYLVLSAIHLPLLSWIALGLSVLGLHSSTEDRFAFLIKSIEAMITAGVYLLAGVAFGGITVGMFAALGIDLPEVWLRLIAAGGFGLLPVLAVATVYDPTRRPSEQAFDEGLSKFIATMMRLLLPLTLVVLASYIAVIPFHFMQPFENRDVLLVYNLMLFAILGLLLGATPTQEVNLSPHVQKWLRAGIIIVAILAGLVSIYALSAIIFRTVNGFLTLNRLTIIGWNTINISILAWLIYKQFKDGQDRWVESLQTVFSRATNAYVIWGMFLLVALPLIF